jgi:glycerol-3-phosphate O-acyltransferase
MNQPRSAAVAHSAEPTPATRQSDLPPEKGEDCYLPAIYEPGAVWHWLYKRFFRHVHTAERWEHTVREEAHRGLVVHVARSLSFLDFLALDFLTKKHALPLLHFVNDVGMFVFEPFGRGARRMRLRAQIPDDKALSATILAGHSALLFLRRPPGLTARGRKGDDVDLDLIRTLVEMQRRVDRPIILVPQTFVWTKRPATTRPTLIDLLFGPAEWPGRIRVFLQFILNHKNALLRSGEPFDIRAFLNEHQDMTDAEASDAIRYALLRRIERERTIVLGPAKKTSTRIVSELMRSPRVRRNIDAAAKTAARPLSAVEDEARRDLENLCAAPDTNVVELVHRFVDRLLWNRIYDGLVVDLEGLERLREAARRGPLVLLPSHKSHVDYLILSDALYVNGLAPPLIAAGDNLSFWPLGPILRRAGAFFIKRSFKGRKLYPQLVDAYVRKVLVEGWHLELFIEGGRSRTGKLLPPKLGILSMIVDAALQLRDREITFVPVSIGYERIIEASSYVHEQAGGEKQPESIGGLLAANKVLRSKYGRLYLQFGELMSFRDLVTEASALASKNRQVPSDEPAQVTDASPSRSLSPPEKRALVQRIAHRVTYEINRATIVTPTALTASALMAHRRRGISRDHLVSSASMLLATLERHGARIAKSVLTANGQFRPETLDEAIRLLEDGKMVVTVDASLDQKKGDPPLEPIYQIPEERRMALEYHKNTVLHFFVPSALIASALLALGGEAERDALRNRVRRLSRLFKLEFMFRADADFDDIFADALASMHHAGEVEITESHIRRGGGARGQSVGRYAEMLRTYFESYRLTLISVHSLRSAKAESTRPALVRKEWLKSALALGHRRWLSGQITLRESVSRQKIENALGALHDHKIIHIEGDQIRAGASIADEYEALDRMIVEHLVID